jgi:hypothetical protein
MKREALRDGTEVQSVSTWRSMASLRSTSPCCPRALPVSRDLLHTELALARRWFGSQLT